ncbi:glycosyltransferase family 4 protein [Pseudomonas sp. BGI-2]|uniref:MraY family glycosyltransferase n=1 Tax=Pseudomonas sp. BGI-2 TaxID=2528211 RepID=UPI0010336A91|nr:glycosyltransferase family 4 protein [Pseudomonas sp. BGI-2]TBN43367.1 glycosyltransferase family 4 protein [Pseudomonas sp. BGI-2]
MFGLIWLIPVVGVLAITLTWVLRRYALHRSVLDIPNTRSSHSVPTPRGGGVAIVISYLVGLLFLAMGGGLSWSVTWALAGAGLIVAVLGFLDDHGHIAARWRLLGHFSAAIWALLWLGGMPPIIIFGFDFEIIWLLNLVGGLYLVWMLNLYNFMDGIDGVASVQAISVCVSACVIYWLSGYEELIWAPLLLSMAVLGFLYWNFPPARIFMGDAGSGFLGVILGVLSLQAARELPSLLWVWLILMGVFIVDATFTLIRRLLRGEKVYEAHRSHAYQFAARKFGKHLPVTITVGAINILWLLPVAICVILLDIDGFIGLIIAYIPLVLLAVKYHSGTSEKS